MTPDEIKALRNALACTAKELAAALGTEQATVLAWERSELFPTKAFVDRMNALRAQGPSSIPRKARGGDSGSPMQALADPRVWEILRKIAAHKKLREEIAKLAERYSDPAEE